MATSPMGKVIHQLHNVILRQDAELRTDGQLLESFIKARDAAALETLVRRYGPMVWGVCRRVLRKHHDAEDAFQATFLVLVRRAHSIVPRAMVRGWLYGVAHKTALKARANSLKRNERERQATDMSEPAAGDNEVTSDWQPLLDREICALPEKYRTVLLLCDLEGKTRKEAARQLGWPEGTVAGRLATARTLLAKRLARHGLAVIGGTLIAALAENAASASVPAKVLAATIQSTYLVSTGQAAASVVSAQVAALTEGVMKTMLLTKLKTLVAVGFLAGVIILGGGLLAQPANPGERAKADQAVPQPPAKPVAPPQPAPSAEKTIRVTYPVADFVIPIQGLDGNDAKKTKEDWLMQKIKRTVAPKTWEDQGGNGALQYFPKDYTLVVINTPQVQNGVRHLLETMRRVQYVQIVVELKLITIRNAPFAKLQQTFPNLKKNGHLVLNDAERFALLTKAHADRATTVMTGPKITLFNGQRAGIAADPIDCKLMALVAGNLQHIDLELNAKIGAISLAKTLRLAEGTTLALPMDGAGESMMILLATPTIFVTSDELALAAPVVIQAKAQEIFSHPSATMPSKEARLAQALTEYERACEMNNLANARLWAARALEIDPTLFSKNAEAEMKGGEPSRVK